MPMVLEPLAKWRERGRDVLVDEPDAGKRVRNVVLWCFLEPKEHVKMGGATVLKFDPDEVVLQVVITKYSFALEHQRQVVPRFGVEVPGTSKRISPNQVDLLGFGQILRLFFRDDHL